MDFNYSDMQRMLLDSAERYLGDRFTLEHRRAARSEASGVDAEAWAAFAELGWLALTIPEAQGGLGGSVEDMAVLSTALGARLVVEPFASTAVLGAHIYARSEGDRSAELAAIAGGEARVALAHDEPGERYAYAAPRRTRVTREGNRLVLNGQKMLAADAPGAGTFLVTATIEGEAGTAIVAVDAQAAGVTASPYPLLDGSRAADIAFDQVALDVEAVIIAPARGQAVLAEALDRATISLLAQAVGSMESCLDVCSAYVKERQQFGQPIGKFQSLQHIMADMFVATHQARSGLYMALAASEAEPAARQRAVSLASITVKEASQLVSRQGLQLHGGYGMTDEYEISHHFRRLMVIEKLFGDIDFHIRRVAAS
ncbi:acyl-CoA/acyl-ACP dehydrogenase [Sphingomonas sp. MG17]|uniref:Acyl-CoA/acyl-ACP dehydrogenase n=1 Tax=Sphingomonas tagetis TaxID=2949092 RepID=A0A9X2KQ10_9SPHN|nr:acyl-CoA dehydrogenase family protein [Sphingomonas tagetis]MCP3731248.1 acyl-CoA/acyl-ACP dehydrogenase [Sphingomonas tagetis]